MKKQQTRLSGATALSIAALAVSNGAVAQSACTFGQNFGALASYNQSADQVSMFYKAPQSAVELSLNFQKLAFFYKTQVAGQRPVNQRFFLKAVNPENFEENPMVTFLKINNESAEALIEGANQEAIRVFVKLIENDIDVSIQEQTPLEID